jgi:hypothetical protein
MTESAGVPPPGFMTPTEGPIKEFRRRVRDYSFGELMWRLKIELLPASSSFVPQGGNMVPPMVRASEATHDHGIDDVARGYIAAERQALFVGSVS